VILCGHVQGDNTKMNFKKVRIQVCVCETEREREREAFRYHTCFQSTAVLVGGPRDRFPVTWEFFWGIRQFHVPWG
jgi:hypothetical protein